MNPASFLTRLPAWSPTKWYLLLANVALVTGMVALSNAGVLPLDSVNFLFFFFLIFLFALYRPGWAFLFLIGLIPLEAVTLAPESWGLGLRPYQAAALVLAGALAARFLLGRLSLSLLRIFWFDGLVLLIPLGAFLSLAKAPDPSLALKQSLVVASFVFLYFLFRQYLQSRDDIRQTLPFFLSSSLVVLLYALWQNLREKAGAEAFNVMAGRPNGTFTESDWLGMFTVFLLAILWALFVKRIAERPSHSELLRDPASWLLFFFHTLALVVLILAVSRSAWLGAIAGVLVMIGCLAATRNSQGKEKRTRLVIMGLFLLKSGILALLLVSFFRLTPFPLFDRASSTGTGLQKITVACQDALPPEKIQHIDELSHFGCTHITLEEKALREARGEKVGEVYRKDPTIEERLGIYQETEAIIREHWLLGIGWGGIGTILGQDPSGTVLNSSNAWLEVWLGSGFIGFLGFLLATLTLVFFSFRMFLLSGDESALFILIAAVGLGIFNLFNSGVLLAFFFLFLALGGSQLAQFSKQQTSQKS